MATQAAPLTDSGSRIATQRRNEAVTDLRRCVSLPQYRFIDSGSPVAGNKMTLQHTALLVRRKLLIDIDKHITWMQTVKSL